MLFSCFAQVEETITVQEVDEESMEEITKVIGRRKQVRGWRGGGDYG